MLRYPAAFLIFLLASVAFCQTAPLAETIAPNRLVIVYRSGVIPSNAETLVAQSGARLTARLDRFGILAVSTASADTAAIQSRLAAQPNVAYVLHDRYVTAHSIMLLPVQRLPIPSDSNPIDPTPPILLLHPQPFPILSATFAPASDSYYDSPQGWAVQQSGGFGDNFPTPSTTGPWNISRGAGIRIAILDSGVDATHPDIAPNLALNLSEVDQSSTTGLPSACDDGTPQDQTGHGTWTASLATGALGPGTGLIAGLAPQATLLNIKVLERVPGAGATPTAACESGQASGLLSWVLQGIADAVANRADIISLSLGTLVDITSGDGAGWQATFNAATYAATQSGVVIVAALGNDGLNLSPTGPNANFVELPAQSRSVLPVIASTNPSCAENLIVNATCAPGPITMPYYSNYGATGAIAAPGGSYPEGPTTSVTGFIMGACSSGLPNTTDGLPASASQPAGQSFGCFNLGHIQYVQAMGTSASAPLVAGAAAILRAAHPAWTAAQIIDVLQSSATQLPALATPALNLPAALTLN